MNARLPISLLVMALAAAPAAADHGSGRLWAEAGPSFDRDRLRWASDVRPWPWIGPAP